MWHVNQNNMSENNDFASVGTESFELDKQVADQAVNNTEKVVINIEEEDETSAVNLDKSGIGQ